MSLTITMRDIELFKKLSSYGMLSTKQIGTVVFNSIASTTVLRRLRLLEAGFYVDRIMGLESQDVLWILTKKGAQLAGVEVPKRHWSKNMLEHDYKLLELRLKLEGAGLVKSWLPEHQIRSMIFKTNNFRDAKKKIIPDGLMSIELNGMSESIAVEVELTMKNIGRYKETFRRYFEKDEIYAVWYLAKTKGTLMHAYRAWREADAQSRKTIRFYGSYLESVLKDPLKAKLLDGKKQVLIRDAWVQEGTAFDAQGVSSQNQKIDDEEIELSEGDHTPIREDVA